ncbi:protein HAPLESS 2 [Sesamum angolense]|uniref:Protein HAPLESS 2 n=1 Tax=Sesamum angolense TaxID=2727404 RepID=A0AAE2BWV0_9LAMI|nr:protein HAPLESS 2 [Sesamum angolense]
MQLLASPAKTVSVLIHTSLLSQIKPTDFHNSFTQFVMKTLIVLAITCLSLSLNVAAIQILSKSKVKKCEKVSESDGLNCTSKIVLDLAVPSESVRVTVCLSSVYFGFRCFKCMLDWVNFSPVCCRVVGEASMVAEVVEAEENSTSHMRTLRVPPVITINKSAAYALYELTYIRDVAYKPQEFYVKTRKCEPEAGADVVKIFERQVARWNGHIIEHTQPTCCPCGDQRRVPSSCGNFFDKLMKGKANTAHCLRFTDDWFHVFGIGQRSIGFSIRIEIKTRSKTSEVIVGPENRTAISRDKFLRVNMVGDYVGYSDIPSFDDFYLVIPRQRFASVVIHLTGYLFYFQADQNRISRNQNAGSHAFSIGITEVLNTNLLVELRADDIEYVYQRSPGKILGITVPTFEALTQFGTARITTKNIGEVEASYSLTPNGGNYLKLLYPTVGIKLFTVVEHGNTTAILKDSDFSEVDRAECQFTTTATVLENGSQIPFQPPKTINGFFESIEEMWNKLWAGLADFITGKSCRRRCSRFFDFSCHIQYICMSWILMFGLFLAIFPTGLFDPIYDWWEDHIWTSEEKRGDIWKHARDADLSLIRMKKIHRHEKRHHKHDAQRKRNNVSQHWHNSRTAESDYHYYLHHVHKDRHKQGRVKDLGISGQAHLCRGEDNRSRHHRRRKG